MVWLHICDREYWTILLVRELVRLNVSSHLACDLIADCALVVGREHD